MSLRGNFSPPHQAWRNHGTYSLVQEFRDSYMPHVLLFKSQDTMPVLASKAFTFGHHTS
jgi:hypothetical protein